MSRYIDVDLLKLGINKNDEIFCTPVRPLIIDLIDNMPTADVQPVKHGYWEDYYVGDSLEGVICTACKKTCTYEFDYCPSCGAIMDGDNNGKDNSC